MSENKFQIGVTYGSLTVLAWTKERGYSQYRVRCENCGREFLATASSIFKYGCATCKKAQLEEEKLEILKKEHIDKTYGNLTVLDITIKEVTRGRKTARNPVALCRCEKCGRESEFMLADIKSGKTKACTCTQPENLKLGTKAFARGKVEDTNVFRMDAALNKNSTTGVKGVSYMPKYGKYRSYTHTSKKRKSQ